MMMMATMINQRFKCDDYDDDDCNVNTGCNDNAGYVMVRGGIGDEGDDDDDSAA